MRNVRAHLLACSALIAVGIFGSQTAVAQVAAGAGQANPADGSAAEVPSAKKAERADAPEDILRDIVVTAKHRHVGGGLMIDQREPLTTNSITAEAISKKAGIAGPYQLVATLPGVNTGLSDPYQMNIRYGLFLRGLPVTDIGWILDGAPIMDRSNWQPYSETNADNENLAGVTVLPGSTRITDPVLTAVGGTILLTLRDPSDEPGAKASYSYGSFHGRRVFGGFDTGYIGNTGLKAYATISETKAGSFALPKDAVGDRLHIDFKVSKDWGEIGKSSVFFSYNNWDVVRSQPYSLTQFKADKASGDFTVGNYNFTFNPLSNSNNYWKSAIYTRDQAIVVWNNQINLSDRLSLTVTPYYHWVRANSPGGSTIDPSNVYVGTQKQTVDTTGLFLQPNGRVPVKSNSLQNIESYGVNSYAKYQVSDSNSLTIGYWHDNWHFKQTSSVTPISGSGEAADFGENPLYSTTGLLIAGALYTQRMDVNALSLQDSQKFLDDRLRIDVGIKYIHTNLNGNNLLPGTQGRFGFKYSKFLPRASASFDIDDQTQIYANFITESRANQPSTVNATTYNTATGAVSQLGVPATKPEYAIGGEVGFRYHDSVFSTDIALFNKKLLNHSIVSQAFLNGAGVNVATNVGGLRMRGATVEVGLRPIAGFSPYANAQYLDTKTLDNFDAGLGFLPTKGKDGVQAPKFTATIGLNYEHGPFFGNFVFKYVGSQFTTFMNDEKMPSFNTIDLGFGYHIPPGYVGKDATIRLSVTNLVNKPYLGASASVQPNAVTTLATNGATIVGRAPTYWLSSPRAIMGTFSTAF